MKTLTTRSKIIFLAIVIALAALLPMTADAGGSGITPPVLCYLRQGITVCIKRVAPKPIQAPRPINARQ